MSNQALTTVHKSDVQIDTAPVQSAARQQTLSHQAERLVARLWAVEARDLRRQRDEAQAMGHLGASVLNDIAAKSAMLKQPLARLMEDAEDGGDVARNLLKLESTVTEINPNQFDFNMSWFRRALSKLPGVGSSLSVWIAKYQSVDGIVQNIIKDLHAGRDQLRRDNITLADDQLEMRELTFRLQDYIALGREVDDTLSQRLATEADMGAERRRFLEEEVLYALRQRMLDLQNRLAVNQQGVLTTEVIIRNNKELMRGVDRALSVTVTALQTAASLSLALSNQQRVLRGVQAVTQATNDMIAQTAEKLKTQGAEIQRQASSSQLDLDGLKRAFGDVQQALNDISNFRREALPQMAQSVLELDELSDTMEQAIVRMENTGGDPLEVLLDQPPADAGTGAHR